MTKEQVDVFVDIIENNDWLSLESKRLYVEKVFLANIALFLTHLNRMS